MKVALKVYSILAATCIVLFLITLKSAIAFNDTKCTIPAHAYILLEVSILTTIALSMLYSELNGYDPTSARIKSYLKHRLDWRLLALGFHIGNFAYIPGAILVFKAHRLCSESLPLWIIAYYWIIAGLTSIAFLVILGLLSFAILFINEVKFIFRSKIKRYFSRKAYVEGIKKDTVLGAHLLHVDNIGTSKKFVYESLIFCAYKHCVSYLTSEEINSEAKFECPVCSDTLKANQLILELSCCESSMVHFSCIYRHTRGSPNTPCCDSNFTVKLTDALKLPEDDENDKSEESDLHPLD